jgi:hypothetical protein
MSNYPPTGQAHPDQPSDPWQEAPLWGGQPGTSAPYGDPSGYIGEQYSPAPVGYQPPPGGGPVQAWGPPQPPPQKQGLSTVAIALITAAVVVVVGGIGLAVYAFQGTGTPAAHSSTGTNSASTGTSASSSPTASATPSERDFRTAKLGDCLVNRGTEEHPELHIVPCTTDGALKVVARFDGTDDASKCDNVKDSKFKYFYRLGETKFVLCFQKL